MDKKPPRPWIVGDNQPIKKLEENLWLVDGTLKMPGAKISRRMAIVKRSDGTLVFHNGIPVDDAALEEIRAWGKPAALIVPNGGHRLDVHAFREKLGVKVYAPKAARDKVAEIVAVDGTYEDLPPDPTFSVETLEGSKEEAAFLVRTGKKGSLLFCDAMMNIPKGSGFMFWLLGSSGGPKCTRLYRMIGMKDKKKTRSDFERLATLPDLAHLIPSHGDVVSDDAAGVLRKIASTL